MTTSSARSSSPAVRSHIPSGPCVELLLLTGCRRKEISRRSGQSTTSSKRLLVIPPERFKSGIFHRVPLIGDAAALVERLPRHTGPYVFTTTDGKKAINGWSKAKKDIDRVMARELGREPERWVIHDLRHTIRTRMAALGARERCRDDPRPREAGPGPHLRRAPVRGGDARRVRGMGRSATRAPPPAGRQRGCYAKAGAPEAGMNKLPRDDNAEEVTEWTIRQLDEADDDESEMAWVEREPYRRGVLSVFSAFRRLRANIRALALLASEGLL